MSDQYIYDKANLIAELVIKKSRKTDDYIH